MKILKRLIICIILILLSIIAVCRSINESIDTDTNSVRWIGYKETESLRSEPSSISIPGFDYLVLCADLTTQKVNIYNPDINECLMIFTLSADDKIIWQSGYCKPGDGYYEIELSEPLEAGVYNGTLLNECFTMNGERLNSAFIHFSLVVQ